MEKDYSEEVARLVYDYAIVSQIPDRNYLDKLADIVVNREELNDYIKKVEVYSKLGFSKDTGYYLSKEGIVRIGLETLIQEYYSSENYTYVLSKKETNFKIYSYVTQAFLHECDHACQFKICYENPTSLEGKILMPAYKAMMLEKDIYNERNIKSILKLYTLHNFYERMLTRYCNLFYYNLSPAERLAEIHSYWRILAIDKILNLQKLYQYHKYELFDIYMDSYTKKLMPTLFFMQKMGYKKEAEEIEKLTKKLDFDTRLELGLDITEKEFKKLERKQEKTWERFVSQK